MSNPFIDSTPANSPPTNEGHSGAVERAIAELKQRAYANAPKCGHVRLDWITVAQAVETFHISKRFLSTLATQGHIQSIKGDSVNCHRLVHIDSILRYLGDRLRESPSSMPPAEPQQHVQQSNIICHSDDSSDSEPASPDHEVADEHRNHVVERNKASKWVFKLKQPNAVHLPLPMESRDSVNRLMPPSSMKELAERMTEKILGSKEDEQPSAIANTNNMTSDRSTDEQMIDAL
jgi:hypothetical protein